MKGGSDGQEQVGNENGERHGWREKGERGRCRCMDERTDGG